MQAFMAVYVPGWLIFIGGIMLISTVNGATVQAWLIALVGLIRRSGI